MSLQKKKNNALGSIEGTQPPSFIQSLLRGQLGKAFRPVYPKGKFADAEVNMWEIHYPPDIKTNDKYLETDFPEIM